MSNKLFGKAQDITVRDLANAYVSADHSAYRKLVNNSPSALRSFLLRSNEVSRFDSDRFKFQCNQMGVIEVCIADYIADIEQTTQDLTDSEQELQEAGKVLTAASNALEQAKADFCTAKANYANCLSKRDFNKRSIERKKSLLETNKNLLSTAKKAFNQSQTYYLIHYTATVSAISRKEGVFLCTKFDAKMLRYRKHVDCVIETGHEHDDMIPADARQFFESDEEFESAKAYVHLVLQHVFNDLNYHLLYNSKGIDYMLGCIL